MTPDCRSQLLTSTRTFHAAQPLAPLINLYT